MNVTYVAFRATLLVFLLFQVIAADAHSSHPLGKKQLDWRPDPNIARTLSMNIDFHGGDWFVSWRRPGHIEDRDGRRCLVGPYFFFDVDDDFAFDIDETVTLELLFDRHLTDGFNLSYDHAINPAAKQVRFDADSQDRWQSVTVKLERARLANRKYGKTDFAIGALGARHPQDRTVNGELALCGMRISREQSEAAGIVRNGFLELNVYNEEGTADSVRVGLYDADGRSPLPGDDAVTLEPFSEPFKQWPLINKLKGWPSEGRFVFYVDGTYQAQVPEGTYDLVFYKGPEYRISHHKINIEAGETSRLNVKLQRWTNMPARGWYSADAHIHIGRPDESKNESTLAFTRAEDIHVANLLQVSNVASYDNYRQYAFGPDGHYIESTHALVSGQESPRTSHRGHSIGLNGTRLVWTEDSYFDYARIAKLIQQDGGLWGYAHVAIDSFNVNYGLALDVPLGAVDFVEMLQMGMLNTRYLYDFLNLGYRILPAAGSDYPFIHVAGSERIYAKVDEEFSPQAWFDAWRNNRSFVSNGPVIDFSVNGDRDKTEFELQRGETINVSASAAVNPDIDLLTRLELVVQGEVVNTVRSESGLESIKLSYDFQPQRSLWFAIRAYGKDNRVAHTAPIYVYLDGNRRFWKPEVVTDVANKYIAVLNAFKASRPDPNEDWERFATEGILLQRWDADKKELDRSIEKAIGIYEGLMEEVATAESHH